MTTATRKKPSRREKGSNIKHPKRTSSGKSTTNSAPNTTTTTTTTAKSTPKATVKSTVTRTVTRTKNAASDGGEFGGGGRGGRVGGTVGKTLLGVRARAWWVWVVLAATVWVLGAGTQASQQQHRRGGCQDYLNKTPSYSEYNNIRSFVCTYI